MTDEELRLAALEIVLKIGNHNDTSDVDTVIIEAKKIYLFLSNSEEETD